MDDPLAHLTVATRLTIGRARHHARIRGVPWAVVARPVGRAYATEARPDWVVGGPADGPDTRVLYLARPDGSGTSA